MNYTIVFSEDAKAALEKWKKSNPIIFKKAQKIILDIAQTPRRGIGHPEPLVGGGNAIWSRRISAHDRVVYEIIDDKVIVYILSMEGHYSDK